MKLSLDLSSLKSRFSYGEQLQPTRDWLFMLSVVTVLIVASVGLNLWLLRSVEQGATIGNEQVSSSFDDTSIEAVRAVFEARKQEELKYRQEYRFVDPSL